MVWVILDERHAILETKTTNDRQLWHLSSAPNRRKLAQSAHLNNWVRDLTRLGQYYICVSMRFYIKSHLVSSPDDNQIGNDCFRLMERMVKSGFGLDTRQIITCKLNNVMSKLIMSWRQCILLLLAECNRSLCCSVLLIGPLIVVINLCSTDTFLGTYLFTGENTDQWVR